MKRFFFSNKYKFFFFFEDRGIKLAKNLQNFVFNFLYLKTFSQRGKTNIKKKRKRGSEEVK